VGKLGEEMTRTLANTVGVGFGRSGTTYVSTVLSKHPEVCFSSKKETHFFSRHYESGLGAYSRYFEHCRKNQPKIVAEWSVDYILHEGALLRIEDSLSSSVRVLVCYRDPVASLRSVIRYKMMRGKIDRAVTIREAVESNWDLVENRFYDVHLARLLGIFPRRNVHVMRFEDMVEEPDEFFEKLYDFLGIHRYNLHSRVGAVNISQFSRSRIFRAVLYRLLRLRYTDEKARRLLRSHPTGKPRWLRVAQALNSRPMNVEFDAQLKQELSALFAPHMRNVERMLGEQAG
jgi:hypothetical protein